MEIDVDEIKVDIFGMFKVRNLHSIIGQTSLLQMRIASQTAYARQMDDGVKAAKM